MNNRQPLPWDEPGRDIDSALIQEVLQRELPGAADGRLVIDAMRVLKVRRSSSLRRNPHPLTMWIELELREAASGRTGVQRLYGKGHRDGAAAAAFEAARAAATARPEFLDAVMHVPGLDMLLWAWPNDPTLTQLPLLLDADGVLAHLPADPAGARETVVAHEVLRYAPETRATLRYALRAEGREALRVVYGKTFADDRAPLLHQRFAHFWRESRRDPDAPRVAEPLGCDAATRTLWQAPARGVPLPERLRGPAATADLAAVGRALARVHRAPLPTRAVRGIGHWLQELDRRRNKIARAAPALAPRAEAVVQRLVEAASRLPDAPPRLLHGDFHPEQIWIDGRRVLMFDFDEFCLGHPMEDLAGFIVRLEQMALPRARCLEIVESLLGGYREAAPANWCAPTLAWYRALQTLLQASRAFVFQGAGWATELEARLARTERLVEELAR